ncbi:nucleoside-diphosphate kinase [Candidatus Synchoanobacter obligatus]|uniref:Nucleoside diphosphate kinase n=1 Tax=Candidatus Synchoanobacter obligatus TaxID=2919597 RepID=A0ABT1L3X5_9GAMM|nr:nucleoside-diphosphate kinase [Candidatus Synchoanobacter obligatus]MCP8351881.1 nucleoside-diphosphate kinase [Candidatus Synchoanobacter obligatus]
MAIEQTLSIIKPDAVRDNNIGNILAIFEKSGLVVKGMKMLQLTQEQAQEFYAVHQERPFYNSLVAFMISGPVVVSILEGENAVLHHRDVMGATNPEDAAEGTIRQLYGANIDNNAVHGSDSLENAKIECDFFFAE